MTRAGPARSLGLKDRGHLGAGASADITVYSDDADREAMFTTPELVFKNGELIVRDGKVVKVVQGATHVVRPAYDRAIERPLKDYFDRYHTVRMENFKLADEEIIDGGRGAHRRAAVTAASVLADLLLRTSAHDVEVCFLQMVLLHHVRGFGQGPLTGFVRGALVRIRKDFSFGNSLGRSHADLCVLSQRRRGSRGGRQAGNSGEDQASRRHVPFPGVLKLLP